MCNNIWHITHVYSYVASPNKRVNFSKIKIKFKIKTVAVWSIFEGWDQKQRNNFVWPSVNLCSHCHYILNDY